MSKKIGLVDNCYECPFFINNGWFDEEKMELIDSECKKLKLKGQAKDLFKVCPLPNYDEITYDSVDEAIYNWDEKSSMQKTDDGFWSWVK